MNLREILLSTLLVAPVLAAESPSGPFSKSAEGLGKGSYAERQVAMTKLWSAGKRVLPLLKDLASGENPESASRARFLMDKIAYGLTPQTPEAVVDLVNTYAGSEVGEREEILGQLRGMGGELQALYLFATEEGEDKGRLARIVKDLARKVARDALIDGRFQEVPDILALASDQDQGFAALAAFYRADGTINAERAQARRLPGEDGKRWQLALARAAGDEKESIRLADALGRKDISGIIKLMQGDPLSLMTVLQEASQNDDKKRFQDDVLESHHSLSIAAWKQVDSEEEAMDMVAQMTNFGEVNNQTLAVASLALNGYREAAEHLQKLVSEQILFSHFIQRGEVDKAFELYGFSNTAEERALLAADYARGFEENANTREITDAHERARELAFFLVDYGAIDEGREILDPALNELRKENRTLWARTVNPFTPPTSPVPLFQLLAEEDIKDAGEVRPDVQQMVAFRNIDAGWREIFTYLEENKGEKAFYLMGVLSGIFADEASVLKELEKEIIGALGSEPVLLSLSQLAFRREGRRGYDSQSLIAIDEAAGDQTPVSVDVKLNQLLFSERWGEASQLAARLSKEAPGDLFKMMSLIQSYKGTGDFVKMRRTRKTLERLLLAERSQVAAAASTALVANDVTYALELWKRQLMQTDVGDPSFILCLNETAGLALRAEEWALAAACSQVSNYLALQHGVADGGLLYYLDKAGRAVFCRGMAELEKGRKASAIDLFRTAQDLLAGSGTEADHFYPALRGKIPTEIYDELFDKTYALASSSLEAFPNAVVRLNSVAWIASRSMRRLDEAQVFSERALNLSPNRTAYLDTLAEVHFAKGARDKALELSRRALERNGGEEMMWRQFRHFRDDAIEVEN